MTPTPATAELIALVEGSPAAVAIHDRDAWLALFSTTAEVCDPYGSQPARGRETLVNFYETFIAPNDISFEVEHDVVSGMTVFRDLTLTTMMSGKVPLHVPMHLRYDVVSEAGSLRIERLHAHWELPTQITQLLAAGFPGIVQSTKLIPKLLANQGLSGTVGFLRGFRRAGAAGKRTAERFFAAAKAGDGSPFLEPGVGVEFPGRVPAAGTAAPDLSTLTWRKLLSAGNTVTATVEVDGGRGVALLEFDHGTAHISRARCFLPS